MPKPIRLSVNLNKIALLRNSRRTGVPDLREFAEIAWRAGCDGLTVHPRPDERHIRPSDVIELAQWMSFLPSEFELNIEGFPNERLIDLVRKVKPKQCTLVPDGSDVLTSDEGWKFTASNIAILRTNIAEIRPFCERIALFIDPNPDVPEGAAELNVDAVEIYTGEYAEHMRDVPLAKPASDPLDAVIATAKAATALGLKVNLGHDLNLQNLPRLLQGIGEVHEASIGHELTVDALRMGFETAVTQYKQLLTREVVR